MQRQFPWLALVLLGAVLGLVFAGVSTYDFVQHLDRQVHSLHCSFIPGMGHSGTGESGCQVAMMSPYSSVFRTHIWGGIPIALPAMSVFAFLLCCAVDLLVTRRKHDRRAMLFLLAAAGLPLLTSLVMLTISLTKLGTTCKLCVGIYISSALVFVGALLQFLRARRSQEPTVSNRFLGAALGLGVAFVLVPVLLYVGFAPDHKRFIGTCDTLPHADDPYKIMVDVGRHGRGAVAIEVLDPLCPACRAFEQRLQASGLDEDLDRRGVLFPLDSTCNWMVTETTHPGACTVSEAVLCAGPKAREVIDWAFAEQDAIRDAAKADAQGAARMVKARFPDLAACVGSADAKSKLNKSLRWSVNNGIHVLTPQLFVGDVKLCDEDVDLGLDYTLSEMIDRSRAGTLKGTK